MQADELEAHRLRIPGDEVHALDRVACGALHQVVERGHRYDAAGVLVEREPDIAEVRPGEDLRLRETVQAGGLDDDPHERLAPVRLPIDPPQILRRHGFPEERMARREDAAHRLDRVARKRDPHAGLLKSVTPKDLW